MATLIEVRNSDGVVGRCDAHCTGATSPVAECECICGGMNHGVGLARAVENTRAPSEGWAADYAARKGLAEYEAGPGEAVEHAALMELLGV